MQFILQLKQCLYTIVHRLLEEFKNFFLVILKYTLIMLDNKSWVRIWFWPGVKSRSLSFLVSESGVGEPTKNKDSTSLVLGVQMVVLVTVLGPDFQKILGKILSLAKVS